MTNPNASLSNTNALARGAIIAALYAVLTHFQNILIPGSATWAIQCRVSEALCVLALFTPAAIPGLAVGCFLFNVSFAMALPLETVMIPLLTNDLFGSASYTKVLGIFTAMNALGLCLGSPLGDLYYDIFGTYKPCFWFFAVSMIAVVVGYRFVIRAAYRSKQAFLAETA